MNLFLNGRTKYENHAKYMRFRKRPCLLIFSNLFMLTYCVGRKNNIWMDLSPIFESNRQLDLQITFFNVT